MAEARQAIVVQDLSKSFRRRRRQILAVDSVSFSVDAGERVACIGPNGAGKSTTIKMLTGILRPSAGRAVVLGHVPWSDRRALARRIGVLFGQRSQLWAELSARDSMKLLGSIHGLDHRKLAERTDHLAGLLVAEDLLDQPVRTLSLGQRMRCELVAAMLHEPELLFLDEPTIGLDIVAKQVFRELLVSLNKELGTTLFLTSHDVPDLQAVAERVIIVNHGRVIVDDSVDELRRSLLTSKLIEVRFRETPDAFEVGGVEVLTVSPTVYQLVVDTGHTDLKRVLNAVVQNPLVSDVSVSDPQLEEVIARIYEARR